jgi:hypothetical protein
MLAVEKWAELLLDIDFSAFPLKIEMGIDYRERPFHIHQQLHNPGTYPAWDPLLRLEFHTVNRDDPNEETTVFHCPFLPQSIETEKEALRFIFDHVREILMHEAAELFFYRGYRYLDPHWDRATNSTIGITWQLPEIVEWNKRI